MSTHAFSYPVLEDPAEDFRLLEFVPDEDENVLACRLTTFKRETAPTYAAVSYEWGIELAKSMILLNDTEFFVKPNLHECLKQLRSNQFCRYYWVDAICIDQLDFDERSAQVSVMGSIYREADFVAAWIGLSTTGEAGVSSTAAIAFLMEPTESWESLYRDNSNDCKAMSTAIADLCLRSYWRRLWIIQEMMLAQRVTVLCGKGILDWNQLRAFFLFLDARKKRISDDFHDSTKGLPDEEYDKLCSEHNKQELSHGEVLASDAANFLVSDDGGPLDKDDQYDSLPKIIALVERHHGNTSCFDLRDKVFGLLGLDPDMQDFVPNYHNTAWELYAKVLAYVGRRHPQMPALRVSQILQKALLVQSYEVYVIEAIRFSEPRPLGEDVVFQETVRNVATVGRVATTTITVGKFTLEDVEAARESLGLHWTNAERSFSGQDYTRGQQSMLMNLVNRNDMFVSTAFGYTRSPDSPIDSDLTMSNVEDHDTKNGPRIRQTNLRFFLTTDRLVGVAGADVAPGDTICQAYAGGAPMFVYRNSHSSDGYTGLIGRCYVWLLVDEYEKVMAKTNHDIDLSRIHGVAVPETYWAPQVSKYQPVWQHRGADATDTTLSFDLETLACMSVLPEYWIGQSNERWYNERTGVNVSSRPFVGVVDRLKVLADTSSTSDEDEDEDADEEPPDTHSK